MGVTRSFVDLLGLSSLPGLTGNHGLYKTVYVRHPTKLLSMGLFRVKAFGQKSPDLTLLIKLENFQWLPLHPSSCFLQLFCIVFGFCWSMYERTGWLWWDSWSLFSRDTISSFMHLTHQAAQVDAEAPPCWELTGSVPFTDEMWSGNGCCIKMTS